MPEGPPPSIERFMIASHIALGAGKCPLAVDTTIQIDGSDQGFFAPAGDHVDDERGGHTFDQSTPPIG